MDFETRALRLLVLVFYSIVDYFVIHINWKVWETFYHLNMLHSIFFLIWSDLASIHFSFFLIFFFLPYMLVPYFTFFSFFIHFAIFMFLFLLLSSFFSFFFFCFFFFSFFLIIFFSGKWHLGGMREENRLDRTERDKCVRPSPNQHGFEEYISGKYEYILFLSRRLLLLLIFSFRFILYYVISCYVFILFCFILFINYCKYCNLNFFSNF